MQGDLCNNKQHADIRELVRPEVSVQQQQHWSLEFSCRKALNNETKWPIEVKVWPTQMIGDSVIGESLMREQIMGRGVRGRQCWSTTLDVVEELRAVKRLHVALRPDLDDFSEQANPEEDEDAP